MLTDLLLTQKFWDRGVDIGVGVITSVLVASVGLCFWRVKLWLDLRADDRKQHQQHRNEKEFANARRQQEARDRAARLRRERDDLAAAAYPGLRSAQQADLWERYFAWLKFEQLDLLPRNLATLNQHQSWFPGLRTGHLDHNEVHNQKMLEQAIKNTELPDEGSTPSA